MILLNIGYKIYLCTFLCIYSKIYLFFKFCKFSLTFATPWPKLNPLLATSEGKEAKTDDMRAPSLINMSTQSQYCYLCSACTALRKTYEGKRIALHSLRKIK